MGISERWKRFRELPSDIKQRLDQLVPLFEKEGVQLAYLFGSLVQHETGHDVDLAVLSDKNYSMAHLWSAITDCLGTERVDLVDLRSASPVLRFEIIRSGQILYEVNDTVSTDFEMSTLRLYKDTAWLRRRHEAVLRERMKQWSLNQNPSNGDSKS